MHSNVLSFIFFKLQIAIASMLSWIRKLSIGTKIKDGLLPDGDMGTAQDLINKKIPSEVTEKDITELKETVYGIYKFIN